MTKQTAAAHAASPATSKADAIAARKAVHPATTIPAALVDFDLLLSPERVRQLEARAKAMEANRRLVFVTLLRTKDETLACRARAGTDQTDALMGMIEAIAGFEKHLKELRGMASIAIARLATVAAELPDLDAVGGSK